MQAFVRFYIDEKKRSFEARAMARAKDYRILNSKALQLI